jgi:hypothetical protein
MSSPPTPSKPKNSKTSETPKLLSLGRMIQMNLARLCEFDHTSRWGYVDRHSIVELLRQAEVPMETAVQLYDAGPKAIYDYLQENPNIVVSEWVMTTVQPRRTLSIAVGQFFSAGTMCRCCLGWRVALGLLGWPLMFLLGRVFG